MAFLNGIRGGKSYQEIDKEMEKDPRRAIGFNKYIFPGTDDYKNSILRDYKNPISISVDIFKDQEGDWKPYVMGE